MVMQIKRHLRKYMPSSSLMEVTTAHIIYCAVQTPKTKSICWLSTLNVTNWFTGKLIWDP